MSEAGAGAPAPGFATRTGRCEIRDGALELVDDGTRGKAAVSVPWLVLGYGLVGAALLVSGVLLLDGSHPAGLIFPIAQALFGAWLVAAAWRSRAVSDARSIPLDRIASIDEIAPLPGRRGHFLVYFDDEGGRRRRRLVMLPRHETASEAEAQFEAAVEVLRAAVPAHPA